MERGRRVVMGVGAGAVILLGSLVAYLALWPVGIEPVAWDPPPLPAAEGPWAVNRALSQVTRLEVPGGEQGPEDIHLLDGGIVGGTHEGSLVRWPLDGGPATVIGHTQGRPLGLHVDADGRLIIADATRGLLRRETDGSLTTLCDHDADGERLVFTDDVDVAPDGTIWFTDASVRFGQPVWKKDIVESGANGKLLRWHPDRPQCEVALDGLHFANGVASSSDGSFILVNETSRYRVRKLFTSGPRAGEHEVILDNLPGFPDGISRGEDGTFWVALASPRNAIVDALGPWPLLRPVLLRLPAGLQPAPKRHPYVVQIDANGQVLRTLQDAEGASYGMVTSVQQHGDRLYLGSLHEPAAAWIPL